MQLGNAFDIIHIMKYNALEAHINKGIFKPCYLLEGDDNWLIQSAINMLGSIVSNPIINFNIFTENEYEENIIDSLKVLPWDSDYRIVAVKDFLTNKPAENSDGKRNTGKSILEYLKDFNPNSILVIVGNKGGEFFSKLSALKEVEVIDCSRLETIELTQYINNLCGGNIESAAAKTLIDYCGRDLGRITAEISKLKAYTGTDEITLTHIREIAIKDDDYKIYELTNCLAEKKADEAYLIWNNLSKDTDDVYLVNSVYTYFRKLLYTAVNKGDYELPNKLGVTEYAFKYLQKSAKQFGAVKLKNICSLLQSLDYRIKSGNIEKNAAADTVILNIINLERYVN